MASVEYNILQTFFFFYQRVREETWKVCGRVSENKNKAKKKTLKCASDKTQWRKTSGSSSVIFVNSQ